MMQSPRYRCLVLGPQGAGKSLLLKKLKLFCGQKQKRSNEANLTGDNEREILPTLPTVGSTVEEIKLDKNSTCLLKEYGGCMAPVWNTAYSDCDLVVYVIDGSNSTQISASTILLLEALGHSELKNKPFLVVFNKLDCQCAMSLTEYKSVMRLDDILGNAPQHVHVVQGSCAEGTALLGHIQEWIVQHTINNM